MSKTRLLVATVALLVGCGPEDRQAGAPQGSQAKLEVVDTLVDDVRRELHGRDRCRVGPLCAGVLTCARRGCQQECCQPGRAERRCGPAKAV